MGKNYCFWSRVMQIVLCILFITPFSGLAQNIQLSGSVFDANKEPVIAASVIEKGTTNGVVTDFDGNFSLNVSPNATIVISYVGYITQEIALNGRKTLNITLVEDVEMLDELVVVGYGTLKKSDMTGAISSVNVEELSKRTTTNPAEALQGKIAGVNIMKSGGNAGSGVQVKIRGVKTFGDNQPLYIIDGFPGDIENINPQDIESMEVLKDGAAAAIYGSVAANGVIILTTKNGKKGETKVDFSTYISMVDISRQLELLNADEYKSKHKEMYENWNNHVANHKDIYDPQDNGAWKNRLVNLPDYVTKNTGVDTDWQDAVLRTGLSQNYMLSVRGGGEGTLYSLSYNRANDKGIFLGNNFRQDNARMKVQARKNIFDIDANLSFKFTDSKQPEYQIKEVYMISPLVPIYNENEKYGYGLTNFDGLPNNRNVMADQHYENSTNKQYYTSGNVSVGMNFTKWLNFKTAFSYRGVNDRQTYHTPPYIADEKSKRDYTFYSETSAYWEETVWDNVLNFNKEFGAHGVNAMAGTSITARNYTWNTVAAEGKTTLYKVENGSLVVNEVPGGFLDPNFSTIGAGTGGTYSGDGSKWEYNRASFFGRLNYNYDNRYLLQATIRRDGSSKFGADSRWGYFPSVALGWRITEESFFPKNGIIDNLKLRASWGRLGNENALGYYDFQALISTYNTMYQGYVKGNGDNAWAGSIARGLENRSLKWETTDTKNVGLDYGLFNNRLSGSLNYYYNQTEDLLIIKALPPSAGLSDPILNVGKMRNTGVEFEANWRERKGEFNYSIGLNLATTNNKVISLADEGQVLYGEGLKYGTEHFPTQTRVGRPIGAFYLYKTDGLFQSDAEARSYVNADGKKYQPYADAGDIKFVDTNGDGEINDDDKVYCGSGIPTLEVNINLSLDYKGFDLSAVLGSAWGHKIYNGNKYFYEGMNSGSNFLASSLQSWTPGNTNTAVPRAIYNDPNGNLKESDRFLEKGDFIRLRQLQLGYSLPKNTVSNLYLSSLRFFVSGENLFTITGYKGIDPEFSRSSVLNAGIDKLIFPFTRQFSVGAQLSF
ncbi:MAG TPA: TonB-dependent receptor [Petrimonas sp.]|uniref:SusC/RagA family TonB-linked outer membrane protein n=1 Tax=Petrimonas sp. TaxID=2023866 RepID=UPI0009618887|nr:TonB-dependent receptor [Petrimonas sp.]MEA5063079.1 TonB-dependent receptor [Petrimonas sp.]OJV35705.1 MAG: SusC/RagA family TonB-linked outer membrane protein [Bacteroidia bacterium 43-41]HHV85673.1 TonB-dependent receptor [Petrimonas sp.]